MKNKLEEGAKILFQKNIHPLIDKVYELNNVNEALTKVANGKAKGKTLIKIGNS